MLLDPLQTLHEPVHSCPYIIAIVRESFAFSWNLLKKKPNCPLLCLVKKKKKPWKLLDPLQTLHEPVHSCPYIIAIVRESFAFSWNLLKKKPNCPLLCLVKKKKKPWKLLDPLQTLQEPVHLCPYIIAIVRESFAFSLTFKKKKPNCPLLWLQKNEGEKKCCRNHLKLDRNVCICVLIWLPLSASRWVES